MASLVAKMSLFFMVYSDMPGWVMNRWLRVREVGSSVLIECVVGGGGGGGGGWVDVVLVYAYRALLWLETGHACAKECRRFR